MINFVASANTTSTPAATMVVTLPTHSEGDVIILSFVHNYNSAVQALTAVSEGYTELAGLAISGLGHQAAIWYKKAGASEVNPTATYSSSSQIMACIASSYSGVDGTVQIDVGPSLWATEDPGDTTVIAPSVTTTLDGAMLINVATADDNDAFTQPTGMTLVDNLEFNSMTISSAYEVIPTAGATGDKTWTFAQNTDEITAVSFALRPATGGSGISISVTEVKSNRIDISSLSISANLTITTTETRSSRVDLSTLSVAGNVLATVTEIKSSRVDNSSVTIDVSALSILVTEIKGSRVDLSSIDIKKEIDLIVTEIKASRQDFSLLNIPVIITINPKNIIRVKRKENTVRVKRNSNIIRVK